MDESHQQERRREDHQKLLRDYVAQCKRDLEVAKRQHYASMMLDSGADIVDVQHAPGHTQLKTTAAYPNASRPSLLHMT